MIWSALSSRTTVGSIRCLSSFLASAFPQSSAPQRRSNVGGRMQSACLSAEAFGEDGKADPNVLLLR